MIISQQRQDHPHRFGRDPAGGPLDAGVRLVKLEEGDQVAAASVIPETESGNGQDDLPLQ